jgi:hypothetical protein
MTRDFGAAFAPLHPLVFSVVLLLSLFILPSLAVADELVFETEADRLEYQNWVVSGGRQAWLYLVESLMVPCFQDRHQECRDNMVTALRSVPDSVRNARVKVGARTERLLFAVRNNQFLYQTAFSVRALKAIVEEGGDCAQWESRAAAFMGAPGGALQRLRNEAGTEIGARTRLPEARELAWVDAQLQQGGCRISRTGD